MTGRRFSLVATCIPHFLYLKRLYNLEFAPGQAFRKKDGVVLPARKA
jgi:hypothetical protein